MELRHICANTWAAVGQTALMGLYRLNATDIVLLDTGLAQQDREGLTALIEDNGFSLRGVICSHAHYDHSGNVAYLQRRFGALAAAPLIEAGIAATPEAYRANYDTLTYAQCRTLFAQAAFTADVIIPAGGRSFSFCGADFTILPLPGHTAGHIGVVTPDNVAYLGDALLGEALLTRAKLPTSMDVRQDLETRSSLRALDCRAYILAHQDICTDIRPLIDRNIAVFRQKGADILACLAGSMTLDDWFSAFCHCAGIHPHSPLKAGIAARNFACFAAWLTDSGAVAVQQTDGARRYTLAPGGPHAPQ